LSATIRSFATFTPLPSKYYSLLEEQKNCVLLETSRFDRGDGHSYFFFNPAYVISIDRIEQVPELFSEIERYRNQGFFAAGYIGYECGYHFEDIATRAPLPSSMPLAWFGLYRHPLVFDHQTGEWEETPLSPLSNIDVSAYSLTNCSLRISEAEYVKKIASIKGYIAAGDTYQVNFTDKYTFDFSGSPVACFASLREKQKVGYSAFINAEGKYILSFSPELFFKISGNKISTRPMKGTARRGRNLAEDDRMRLWLQNDEKNRSENLMIVDLLRNDVGRISEIGSVEAKEMFSVEKYETLFQMTSTVEGTLRPGLSLYEIFRSIFPNGSVTGAPKIRTMQIIHEMEDQPRGVYTGALGFFSPKKEAVFNVAIRTILLDGKKGEMGVGGGIVFDSDPMREYEECTLKADFLTQQRVEFQLIESILWDGDFRLLGFHMERLQASAEYFNFSFHKEETFRKLKSYREQLPEDAPSKVRLLLGADGTATLESQVLTEKSQTSKILLSGEKTSSKDRFLYHKTTRRELYEKEFARVSELGYADVVFRNERGEITEGAISNIFIEKEGKLYTPPLECGLLPGVFRRHILETDAKASERILLTDDLAHADAIYLCNAIRGMRRVVLATW
jgi:para-aminobenzoate synthetase/4-amino-4-deoxychorismate lyase